MDCWRNEGRTQFNFEYVIAPEINVTGNSQTIPDNDNFPSLVDGTDFGDVDVSSGSVTHTFTIQNLGNANLNLTEIPRVTITGHTSDFTVTVQTPLYQPSHPATAPPSR